MCGRYTLAGREEALIEAFDVPALTFTFVPRYNIAPGQPSVVVGEDRRGRRMGQMVWGFQPAWKTTPGRPLFNARAESVGSKPSFRDAFHRRRCLVPASGFFEWQKQGAENTPFWFHPTQGGLVGFAGVWERSVGPGGAARHGFAILTTDANADVGAVHHRMPAVIPPEAYAEWLAGDADPARLRAMLGPAAPGTFAGHPVSTRVNAARDDDAGLIDRV